MHWIHKKLNSRSGISLAIALVFFLLCAMVGTVVLSAASVSAGNTARERQLYRETLALTSAANALSQDIKNMTFTGAYKRIETVTTTSPADPETGKTTVKTDPDKYEIVEDASIPVPVPRLENSALFKLDASTMPILDDLNLFGIYQYNYNQMLSSASPAVGSGLARSSFTRGSASLNGNVRVYTAEERASPLPTGRTGRSEERASPLPTGAVNVSLLSDPAAPGDPEKVKITFKPVEEKNIPKVTGTVTVKKDYTITVELKSESEENTLTMTFSPNVAVKTESTVTNQKINSLVSVKTTVTTYTTTLNWNQPTMREGGGTVEETT